MMRWPSRGLLILGGSRLGRTWKTKLHRSLNTDIGRCQEWGLVATRIKQNELLKC